MDKVLLTKVKALLVNCNPDNTDEVKTKLMVILKPSQADEVYEYFVKIEPDYIKENCKVHTYQVIPQYGDYFTDNNSISDIFLDEFTDQD